MSKFKGPIIVGVAWVLVAAGPVAAVAIGYGVGKAEWDAKGYARGLVAGKIEGYKQAQSPELVADRCVAFWFGGEREAAKTLQRYCKIQGGVK